MKIYCKDFINQLCRLFENALPIPKLAFNSMNLINYLRVAIVHVQMNHDSGKDASSNCTKK